MFGESDIEDSLSPESLCWIYILRRDQLVEHCEKVRIVTEGYTVGHLQRQLSKHLWEKRTQVFAENLLRELEKEVKSSTLEFQTHTTIEFPKSVQRMSMSDLEVMNIIHRWWFRYSGGIDFVEFLERLEEFAVCHSIPIDRLLASLLTILEGTALKWYRVKREDIKSWPEVRSDAE